MLETLKILYTDLRNFRHLYMIDHSKEFAYQRDMAFIVRYVHSIEKGLSIASPRSGFGYEKIIKVFDVINKYIQAGNQKIVNQTEVFMFVDAMEEYFAYHEEIGFVNDKMKTLHELYMELVSKLHPHQAKYGGTLHIVNQERVNTEEVIKLFKGRHSLRAFSKEHIPEKDIMKAIELASCAPSACNRQGTRIHIVKNDKKKVFDGWLSGVGGFAEQLDTIIVLTAKESCYVMSEQYQYIVSTSIFAGYLSLALQTYGIGACIIQRPVVLTNEWTRIRKELQIPEDEQVVCLLGCGMPGKEYKVPVSHRLSFDELARFH